MRPRARAARSPRRRGPLPPPVHDPSTPPTGSRSTIPTFGRSPARTPTSAASAAPCTRSRCPTTGTAGSCCSCTASASSRRSAAVSPPHIRRYLHRPRLRVGCVELQQHVAHPGPRRRRDRRALGLLRAQVRAARRGPTSPACRWAAPRRTSRPSATANRFDGALALCGAAGQTRPSSITADFFAAGAYVAGVTQADYDNSTSIAEPRRRPDPSRAPRSRPKHERVREHHDRADRRTAARSTARASTSRRTRTGIAASCSSRPGSRTTATTTYPDRRVQPRRRSASRRTPTRAACSSRATRRPASWRCRCSRCTRPATARCRSTRRRSTNARSTRPARATSSCSASIRDPGHCGFTDEEWAASLDALVAWVEHGDEADGHQRDGRRPPPPRPHVRAQPARRYARTTDDVNVPGASDRAVLRGARDARRPAVRRAGSSAPWSCAPTVSSTACQLTLPTVDQRPVRDHGARRRGRRRLRRARRTRRARGRSPTNKIIYSRDAVPWPGNGRPATVDVTLLVDRARRRATRR